MQGKLTQYGLRIQKGKSRSWELSACRENVHAIGGTALRGLQTSQLIEGTTDLSVEGTPDLSAEGITDL